MEGMHLINDLLQESVFLIKIDLKDTYFCIALDKSSRKYICFQWEGGETRVKSVTAIHLQIDNMTALS